MFTEKSNVAVFVSALAVIGISNAIIAKAVGIIRFISVQFSDKMHHYLMLGSSRPRPFFLSTTLSTSPRIRAATPSEASITRGAV